MTEALLPIVQKINGYLSDYILVALLIAVGLWYSIKTRFVQVRHFKEGWNSVFGSLSLRGGKQESGMSSFRHRHCGAGRHRQYRRRVRRDPHRRPRRHLLDVGHRLPRHGDHLRGSHARAGNAHRG